MKRMHLEALYGWGSLRPTCFVCDRIATQQVIASGFSDSNKYGKFNINSIRRVFPFEGRVVIAVCEAHADHANLIPML